MNLASYVCMCYIHTLHPSMCVSTAMIWIPVSLRTHACTHARCYEVTPTLNLKVVQKVLKCDVTLLSIYNSDWSQKGKFNSCNIITLDV